MYGKEQRRSRSRSRSSRQVGRQVGRQQWWRWVGLGRVEKGDVMADNEQWEDADGRAGIIRSR